MVGGRREGNDEAVDVVVVVVVDVIIAAAGIVRILGSIAAITLDASIGSVRGGGSIGGKNDDIALPRARIHHRLANAPVRLENDQRGNTLE
jgi:hypothetical protein